jgi:hypothetical protein
MGASTEGQVVDRRWGGLAKGRHSAGKAGGAGIDAREQIDAERAGGQVNAGWLANWQAGRQAGPIRTRLQCRQGFIEVDGQADSGQVLAYHVFD